jgi:hypothetical protein
MLATEGYCVKCKAKRQMKGESQVIMKNGRPATKGTCSVCGTKMFKIGGGPSKAVKGKAKPKSKSKSKAKSKSKSKAKPKSKSKAKPRRR